MYGFNSTFITISAICLVLRLYTRLFVVRAPGADDLMAVVSFVSLFRPSLVFIVTPRFADERFPVLCYFSIINGYVL